MNQEAILSQLIRPTAKLKRRGQQGDVAMRIFGFAKVGILGALVAMMVTAATGASYAAQKWNFVSVLPSTNFHVKNATAFADAVRKATNGEVTITIHPGGGRWANPHVEWPHGSGRRDDGMDGRSLRRLHERRLDLGNGCPR